MAVGELSFLAKAEERIVESKMGGSGWGYVVTSDLGLSERGALNVRGNNPERRQALAWVPETGGLVVGQMGVSCSTCVCGSDSVSGTLCRISASVNFVSLGCKEAPVRNYMTLLESNNNWS